jgi:predicted metalloprotease
MRWRGRRQSGNIEDLRGRPSGGLGGFPRMRLPGAGGPFGGGFGPRSRLGGALGLIVIVVVILLSSSDLFGPSRDAAIDDRTLPPGETGAPGASDELREFIAVVLADTEDVWHELFQELGASYEEPTLVLFSGDVGSGCGFAEAATGPFYCPADRKIYLDLGFYRALRERFGAPGDFAQAYVLAHEVGHHVQNLMGVMDEVAGARSGLGQEGQNALSVRVELQADCFAGLWAHHADRTKRILEPGDIDEALAAAAAVGDDRIQEQTRGYVEPESFAHGTAEQRARWFHRGFEQGGLRACDTFSASNL